HRHRGEAGRGARAGPGGPRSRADRVRPREGGLGDRATPAHHPADRRPEGLDRGELSPRGPEASGQGTGGASYLTAPLHLEAVLGTLSGQRSRSEALRRWGLHACADRGYSPQRWGKTRMTRRSRMTILVSLTLVS